VTPGCELRSFRGYVIQMYEVITFDSDKLEDALQKLRCKRTNLLTDSIRANEVRPGPEISYRLARLANSLQESEG